MLNNKELEKELNNAFNNAIIYGTGIITITIKEGNSPEIKSLKPSELKELANYLEDTIVRELG